MNTRHNFPVLVTTRVLLVLVLWITKVKSDMFGLNPSLRPTGKDITEKVFKIPENNSSSTSNIFPVAYGDFNADKLTDIVILNENRSSLGILLASQDVPYMKEGPVWNFKETTKIISVALGDFTGDGLIDIMLTILKTNVKYPLPLIQAVCYNVNGTHQNTKEKYRWEMELKAVVEVQFCRGNATLIDCSYKLPGSPLLVQEPMALDLNRDMILDLVGEKWSLEIINKKANRNFTVGISGTCQFLQSPKMHKKRSCWLSELNQPGAKNPDFKLKTGSKDLLEMADISSNAFADVDGDLVPELVITTKSFLPESEFFREVYEVEYAAEKAKHHLTFRLKSNGSLDGKEPKDKKNVIGQPLFIDLERNGKLVQLMPFCSKLDCSNVDGNQIMAIDEQGKNATLSLGTMNYDGLNWKFIAPINPVNFKMHGNHFDMGIEEFYNSSALTFRAGDYNLDGYPDLIAVLETHGQERRTKAVIFENVPCSQSPENPCPFSRAFATNFDFLNQYEDVVSASFFDLHENGIVDILIVKKAKNSSSYEIRAFENTPNFDSYFIKVAVLTGRACQQCSDYGTPYGTLIPGALMGYVMHDQYGKTETAVGAQMYRTSHMPMDMPYMIFGIGHSPNFVEHLKVTIGYNTTNIYSHDSHQIIPNSQIIGIPPFPLEGHRKSWRVKLFLTPSDAVLHTFVVLTAIIVIVGVMAVGLEVKERREDRRDRLAEANRFMM